MMAVWHENAAAPPDDPIGLIKPHGWLRVEMTHSRAWIVVDHLGDQTFLLHWIESDVKGWGSKLLGSISRWADEERRLGSLVCEPELCPFYERQGWEKMGPFAFTAMAMGRTPRC